MKYFLALALTVTASSFSTLAFATDCSNALTTVEMKYCANEEYVLADKELNAVWPLAMAYLKRVDAGAANSHVPDTLKPAASLLVQAQREWIKMRDLDCAIEVAHSEGGSIQPIELLLCKAAKTRTRTTELRAIASGNALDFSPEVQDRFLEIQSSLYECKDQSSTVAWKFCIGETFLAADRALNTRYSAVKNALASYPKAVNQLVTSELAWISLRDNECSAVTRENFGGTGYTGYYSLCMIGKTIARTFEINSFEQQVP